MTNEEFKYWIKGYLSLTSEEILDKSQFNIIINHANLVKAITGELDLANSQFISILEDQVTSHKKMNLLDLRTIYMDLFN